MWLELQYLEVETSPSEFITWPLPWRMSPKFSLSSSCSLSSRYWPVLLDGLVIEGISFSRKSSYMFYHHFADGQLPSWCWDMILQQLQPSHACLAPVTSLPSPGTQQHMKILLWYIRGGPQHLQNHHWWMKTHDNCFCSNHQSTLLHIVLLKRCLALLMFLMQIIYVYKATAFKTQNCTHCLAVVSNFLPLEYASVN